MDAAAKRLAGDDPTSPRPWPNRATRQTQYVERIRCGRKRQRGNAEDHGYYLTVDLSVRGCRALFASKTWQSFMAAVMLNATWLFCSDDPN